MLGQSVFPEPILWCLWKPSLFIISYNTYTHSNSFHDNPASLQVVFKYCLNCSCLYRNNAILFWLTYYTLWWWAMTEELLASVLSSLWVVLWSLSSFFPTGDPEHTFHSFEVCLQQLLFPFLKKCLLSIKAKSSLGSGSRSGPTLLC